MNKGVYCLVLQNREACVEVGALGPIAFPAGFHVYVGSALGPGGLARVARHIRVSRSPGHCPRWHIDHLLIEPSFRLAATVHAETGGRYECRLAASLPGMPVRGFGCSDCRCPSHLFHFRDDPVPSLIQRLDELGLVGIITML